MRCKTAVYPHQIGPKFLESLWSRRPVSRSLLPHAVEEPSFAPAHPATKTPVPINESRDGDDSPAPVRERLVLFERLFLLTRES